MSLPSQQQRGGGGSSVRFGGGGGGRRGARARTRRAVGLVVIAGAAVVAWAFWPSGDGKRALDPMSAGAATVPAAGGATEASRGEAVREPAPIGAPNDGAGADSGSEGTRGATTLADRGRASMAATGDGEEGVFETPGAERAAGAGRDEDAAAEAAAAAREDALAQERARAQEAAREAARAEEEADRAGEAPVEVRGGAGVATRAIAAATSAMDRNRPVEARDVLNRALFDRRGTEADRARIREAMGEVAALLTFSARVVPGDTTVEAYEVRSGDSLAVIPRKGGYAIDHRLIQRVNGLANPNRIRLGQSLKVLRGPFHAVVDKSAFRMDIYAEQADSEGNRLYIRSFDVGLGEYGSTPVGRWRVSPKGVGEKLINPGWTNPRTNETFGPDDPKNPIGERWIPLEGLDEATRAASGYGIHGTIEPDSIGREMSMGCIRMRPDDVALVYEMLVPEKSRVEIVE